MQKYLVVLVIFGREDPQTLSGGWIDWIDDDGLTQVRYSLKRTARKNEGRILHT